MLIICKVSRVLNYPTQGHCLSLQMHLRGIWHQFFSLECTLESLGDFSRSMMPRLAAGQLHQNHWGWLPNICGF